MVLFAPSAPSRREYSCHPKHRSASAAATRSKTSSQSPDKIRIARQEPLIGVIDEEVQFFQNKGARAGLPDAQKPNPVEPQRGQVIQVAVRNVVQRGGSAKLLRSVSQTRVLIWYREGYRTRAMIRFFLTSPSTAPAEEHSRRRPLRQTPTPAPNF